MDNQQFTKLPIFFIVGRPRSGTTLLRTLFDAHSHVCIPLETPFICLMYSKYGYINKWDNDRFLSFYNDLMAQPKMNEWTLNKEELKNEITNLPSDINYASLCKWVYTKYISFYDKEKINIVGDKNPPFSLSIALLRKIFPEAKFIHLIRDYRDNILSVQKVDFESPYVASLATRWVFYNRKIEEQKQKNPELFYTIKYENLVSNPEKYLSQMCKFLDVPYQQEVLKFFNKKEEVLKAYSVDQVKKYHSNLMKPVNTDNIDNWKNKMTEKDIKIADVIAGSYAEKYGYFRKYPFSFSFYFLQLPGIIFGKSWYLLESMIMSFPFSIKMSFINFWNK